MKGIRYIALAVTACVVVTLSSCLDNSTPNAENSSPSADTNPVTQTQVNDTDESKDVDYMTKLALMKGHLLVAKELLDKNESKQADPHIGHPVEELYGDVEEQLNAKNVKEFKTTLNGLNDLVKATPKDAKVTTSYNASMEAVDNAIAALPEEKRQNPAFVLKVINGLLDTAADEYKAAIADGKIVEAVEYQDSRGFVIYASELYKGIADKMKQGNPEVHETIETSMTQLAQAWPSVIPPSAPVKTPEEVSKLVKTIEENIEKVS